MGDAGAAARERLIVALDLPALDGALALVARLDGVADRFKVGLELFTAVGPEAVRAVRARGGRVFLDLKLHDIPETVRRAARAAATTGAELLTVHADGGRAMLEAAVAGAREAGEGTRVLAITVLTSMDLADLAAVGTPAASVEELVLRRARLAHDAGCHGVVASPREARAIRGALGLGFLIVTPGIRPSGSSEDSRDPRVEGGGSPELRSGEGGRLPSSPREARGVPREAGEGPPLMDQKRVATARQAIDAGADAVVVGRPIRDAADPAAAAAALLAELS